METDSHDSVGVIKGLLDSITVVNIDIEVKDSRVDLQKLEDTEYDVIDVAKTTGLWFFGMMETSWPVDDNISLACKYEVSSIDASSCSQPAEVKESLETRTVKGLVHLEDRP